MEFFEKAFNWLADVSSKLPKIDFQIFFIVVAAVLFGLGIVFAFTYLGSKSFKLIKASKKIQKYLEGVDTVDDDNVSDFTAHCFSAKAPQALRDSWVQYLGVRFGYPSDIVSDKNVYDKTVKKNKDYRAGIYLCVSLVLLAIFAFWGYGTLDKTGIGTVHFISLVVIGLMYLFLILINRAQNKRCLEAFDAMQEDLDAKVNLQVEKNYATDSSPLSELAGMVEEIIARNTSKAIDVDEEQESVQEPTPIEALIEQEEQCESVAEETPIEEAPVEELTKEPTEEVAQETENEVESEEVQDLELIEETEPIQEEETVEESAEAEEAQEETAEENAEEQPLEEETVEEQSIEEEQEALEETQEQPIDATEEVQEGETVSEDEQEEPVEDVQEDVVDQAEETLDEEAGDTAEVEDATEEEAQESQDVEEQPAEEPVEDAQEAEEADEQVEEAEESDEDQEPTDEESAEDVEEAEETEESEDEAEEDETANEEGEAEESEPEVVYVVDGEEEDDEVVKPAKLVKLPNLVDYMLSKNMPKAMKIQIAGMLIGTYKKVENSKEDRKIVVQCLTKVMRDLQAN